MNHEEIWKCADEGKCPVCKSKMSYEIPVVEHTQWGKTLAEDYICFNCDSEIRLGYRRTSNPIDSEILKNNHNSKN